MMSLWNIVLQKNVYIAYVLWLFFGTWGVHHFYLGRHNHAFVCWGTIGGFFWIGWIRDLWRIPAYVREANETPSYLDELSQTMRRNKSPRFSFKRFMAQFFFGMSFGVAFIAGVPMDENGLDLPKWLEKVVHSIFTPLGIAFAVHVVANIAREKASKKWPLIGAYMVVPIYLFGGTEPGTFLNQSVLGSALLTHWRGKSWRRKKASGKASLKRIVILVIAGFIYSSLWFSAFFNNAYVTTQDGEKVRLRDAFGNIKESRAWREPMATLKNMWIQFAYRGFFQTWSDFVNAMDPEGESRAYQVLELSPGATEQEIKKAYRKMTLKYHPDRNGNTEEEFMQVQKAYDTLSKIKGRRTKANKQNREDDDHREL